MSSVEFIPDEKMHAGHRSRMRDKFLKYGARFFDTYELLEMLLYYSIPYKDTNPIAKRLLMHFGSLDRVLSASAEELTEFSGIGKRTAELICAVNSVVDALFIPESRNDDVFNDYERAGEYLAEHLSSCNDKRIVMLLLDNSMRKIDLVTIYTGKEYGSAAVKPKPFIDAAILSGASVVMTAHNHLFGPPIPLESEIATNKLVSRALSDCGIIVAEHYVTIGKRYYGSEKRSGNMLNTYVELQKFWESKDSVLSESEEMFL